MNNLIEIEKHEEEAYEDSDEDIDISGTTAFLSQPADSLKLLFSFRLCY